TFVNVKKECSFDALASNELTVLAAWWLRARISTRFYLAVHPRTGRFPLAVLYRRGTLCVDV
ncbi:MAG TPA: hypothetical protein VEP90_26050, partial [Methylomirabilota bacterium]|nr:hypothetical protein [Methylomirabilota bacterium]